MKRHVRGLRRAALGLAAGTVASLGLAGQAQAQFTGPGLYVIQVGNTGTMLDIDGTAGGGRHVLRWGRNGGANQTFMIFPNGDGYMIRALHSLQCLDLPGWGYEAGLEIVQYHCTGHGNQRFYIDNNVNGTASIRAAHGNNILFAESEGRRVKLARPRQAGTLGTLFRFEPR